MLNSIVAYVSGHGFGHAARVNAVLRDLVRAEPSLRILVRTLAVPMMFDEQFVVERAAIDVSAVETSDALSVDARATAKAYRELLTDERAIVEREADVVRQIAADLIFADLPFLAGDIAAAAGLPCAGMGNFTWDWVLSGCGDDDLLERMRDSYRRFRVVFRLPLSHAEGWDPFPKIVDVPLVTPRSSRPRDDIRRELGLRPDARNVVLIGGRAKLSREGTDRLQALSEYTFLTAERLPVYSDLIRAADIVVSKIGYSIAAECIAEQRSIVYPPRTGFPEETILGSEVPKLTPALPIPHQDWAAGNWLPWLRRVEELPVPQARTVADGAQAVARQLLQYGR
ncbi:MAG TPA: hypothetical protein VES20_15505 [Bryobacteraceae bacterium]|nr:hypothetical protein [Bryobacteraceae bacterium]